MSLLEFYVHREELAGQRVLALRHDIDNNIPQGVRLFFDLEREFEVSATYYFRLKTLAMWGTVKEILDYGSEVGYHFEEAATLAKRCKMRSRRELDAEESRARIDQMMVGNIASLNSRLGIPIKSLSSHSDFYNRRLGVENHWFLSDRIRQDFDILFEVHDSAFLSLFDRYASDVSTDSCLWNGDYSPLQAMCEGVPKIWVLTHERQWHPDFVVNTSENMRRLIQELYYRSMGL
jgi:hypothetical protein